MPSTLEHRCDFQAPLRKLVKGRSQKPGRESASGVGVGELEEERKMKKGCEVMARAGWG